MTLLGFGTMITLLGLEGNNKGGVMGGSQSRFTLDFFSQSHFTLIFRPSRLITQQQKMRNEAHRTDSKNVELHAYLCTLPWYRYKSHFLKQYDV